ncbi:MAG: hypothetical protein GWP14_11170, partial [Actinobacteria bacterium]|nr:hypothetical protein [Actinomycetota bacterium]
MGQKVTLLDRSEWTFINGVWHDGPDGELLPSDSLDIPLMAVRHKSTYGDLRVSFRFRIDMTGAVQFLFAVQDPNHYYALDFPACGQQVRAKHFWAGISKSLGHGHDEYLGLEMVRGVPAEYGRWYKARLERRGSCIRAWIEDRPSL